MTQQSGCATARRCCTRLRRAQWGLQQQAALAFEQAKREGASEAEVMAVQRDVVRRLVVEACGLAVQPAVAISSGERG